MIELSLEGRYAKALYSISEDYELILENLSALCAFFDKNTSFFYLLCSGSLKKESAFFVGEQIVKNLGLNSYFLNFLKLLMSQKRLRNLHKIKKVYSKMVNKTLNREEFCVECAALPNDKEKATLHKCLEDKFEKEISLSWVIAPYLIGGFAIKNDSYYWDVSFRAQLSKLESILLPNQ
jgi:ATP synthase F1 delta subunit